MPNQRASERARCGAADAVGTAWLRTYPPYLAGGERPSPPWWYLCGVGPYNPPSSGDTASTVRRARGAFFARIVISGGD